MKMGHWTAFVAIAVLALTSHGWADLQIINTNGSLVPAGFCTPSVTNGTDLGNIDVSTGQVFATFMLTNSGTGSILLSGITNVEDCTGSFVILNDYENIDLPANNSLTLPIRFTPKTNGLIRTTIFADHNDAYTNNPYLFVLQGTGTAGEMILSTTNGLSITNGEQSASTDFGIVPVDHGMAFLTFSVSNSGTGVLLMTNVLVSSHTDSVSTICYPQQALTAGKTGLLSFMFDPTITGPLSTTVSIYHAVPYSHPFDIVLTGIATAPGLTLLGTNLSPMISGGLTSSTSDGSLFSDVHSQQPTSTHEFQITNEGYSVISISGITFEGTDATDFSCDGFSGATITAGASTPLMITFDPTHSGLHTARMMIHSSDTASPHNYTLAGRSDPHCMIYAGTNNAPIINNASQPVSENNTDFGILSSGSITKSFFITNSGASTLLLTNVPPVTLSGLNTNGFEILSWPATSLPPGNTSSFSISYTPVSPNARTVTVVVANNDTFHTNAPFSFGIRGSGVYSNILMDTAMGLPDLANGQACWGDYDQDGFLDLVFSGRNSNGLFSALFHNEEGLSFSNTLLDIPAAESSSADWGDYDNDGDLDLIFCGFRTNGMPGTTLFRNDTGNVFTEMETPFADVYSGSIRWGDYDNDGYLDLALCGFCDVNSNVTFIYHNEGNGTFTNAPFTFTGIRDGGVEWSDYDNDGWLDLLVSGESSGGKLTRLYRNNGTTFTNAGVSLPGCALGRARWIDFDCDGDMDLSFSGYGQAAPLTRLYRYIGGSAPFFRIDTNQLSGCWLGDSAWGDYDSDGDPDLLVSGIGSNGTFVSDLYYNDGFGNLNHTGLPLPPLKQTVISWADINADGIVDLLLAGRDTNGAYVTKTFINTAPISNTPPRAPDTLSATITNGYELTLSWLAAEDNQTPSEGLAYALFIGTSSNTANIQSPMADLATGTRHLVRPVNQTKRFSYRLPYIPPSSNFYWGVQAIDSCNAGGAFAYGTPVSRDPLPDFSVSTISYLQTPFTVYVTITNKSSVSADAGTLALWLNSPTQQTTSSTADRICTVGMLNAGEGRIITFTNFLLTDAIVTNTIRAFINADGGTHEETVTNNQRTVEHVTTVVDPFWFRAFALQDSNTLRWPNPVDCGLQSEMVCLRYSTVDYPAGLSDGFLLYVGTNRVYHHTGLTPRQPYYYTIWVSNDGTNYIIPPISGSQ